MCLRMMQPSQFPGQPMGGYGAQAQPEPYVVPVPYQAPPLVTVISSIKKPFSPVAIIGSLILIGSLFLPYLDLGLFGSLSGFEVLEFYGELADSVADSGSGDGGSSGGDVEIGMLGWAIILLGFSPVVNVLMGGLCLILSLCRVGLRWVGSLHLVFSGALLITTIASAEEVLGVKFSMMDVWGVGIWVAMVGGLIVTCDPNSRKW